ncbi:hypothetical protein [Pseudomonas sp. 29]|uniref:hypothetical protein n=1 Tax=Pseudomonas TaxID=286 RepID=UPI00336ACE0E
MPEGKTYNLTVDVGHTFYVGELKTWVHNTGPCDLPPILRVVQKVAPGLRALSIKADSTLSS